MKRIPPWLLVTETILMALLLVSLLSTVTSSQSSLLPEPAAWVVIALAALALVASLIELGRRRLRRY